MSISIYAYAHKVKMMGRQSALDLAKELIRKKINSYGFSIFGKVEISRILRDNRETWGLPKYITVTKFLEFLLKSKIIKEFFFNSDDYNGKAIYATPGVTDVFTVAAYLKRNAYYSFYSAMFLHQLTLQIPKTHYLNYERYSLTKKSELTQSLIDHSFSKEKQKTNLSYYLRGYKFYFVNGSFTDRLGVVQNSENGLVYRYTDLERTLIDIVVRPYYSGGVAEVLEAFNLSKDRFDPEKLQYYLGKLDYLYPYHQSIGFYLEKVGVADYILDLFRKDITFDFYLTYNIRKKEYNENWKVYYPRGL